MLGARSAPRRPARLGWGLVRSLGPLLAILAVVTTSAFAAADGAVAASGSTAAAVHSFRPTTSNQVVVVSAASWGTSSVTVTAYRWTDGAWVAELGPFSAGIGANGFTATPTEADNYTPIGQYDITTIFGSQPDPGTLFPYRTATNNDHWVDDPTSSVYNTWQVGSSNGRWKSAETLSAYRYAAAFDFNQNPVVPNGNSAIFLHGGGGATPGCIELAEGNLLKILRWLDPTQSPQIVMGVKASPPTRLAPARVSVSSPVASLARGQQTTVLSGFSFLASPQRMIDTRPWGYVAAGQALRVSGMPIGADATGAVVSVTAVTPAAAGYLTVYPCTPSVPDASTANFAAGQTRAAVTVAALDADGGFCVYSSARTDLLVDVLGATSPTGPLAPRPVSPVRALDTRSATRVAAATPTTVDLPTGAPAAMVNLTITAPAADGYATVYPADADAHCGAAPGTSVVNFVAGETVPVRVDAATTPTSPTTSVMCVWSSVATHVLVDLEAGYVTGPPSWTTLAPTRVMDTRPAGPATSFAIPTGPHAVVGLTVTAIDPAQDGFVTVYPTAPDGSCTGAPTASLLNPGAHAVQANSLVVGATSGTVCATASRPIDLAVDVVGASGAS